MAVYTRRLTRYIGCGENFELLKTNLNSEDQIKEGVPKYRKAEGAKDAEEEIQFIAIKTFRPTH